MSSIVMLIAAFVSFTRSASAAANPNICATTQTSHPILQLQNGQRCLWISTPMKPNWNASMTYCQGYNSYLAHIYSSDDYNKIMAWTSLYLSSDGFIGMKSFLATNGLGGLLSSQPPIDGTSVYWMYSTTSTMPFAMNNQYIGFIANNINAWGISPDVVGGVTVGYYVTDIFARILSTNAIVIQDSGNGHAICEQSTTFMNSQFTATAGKQSPAYVTQSLTGQTIRQCSKQCAHTEYCMGYNVLNAAAGSISTQTSLNCNMLSVRLADRSLSLTTATSNVYYERSTSAPPP